MASTNFLVFDEGKQNMMSDGDYSANTQRARGVTPGIAYPNLHNKLYYQVSVMAKAIADFMVAQGANASDEDVEQLTADISTAFTKFVDKQTKEKYLPLSGGTLTGSIAITTPKNNYWRLSDNNVKMNMGFANDSQPRFFVNNSNSGTTPFNIFNDDSVSMEYATSVKVPTPSTSDNSTKVATTAFVKSLFTTSRQQNGWWGDSNTGIIWQWGSYHVTGTKQYFTFPITFPHNLFVITEAHIVVVDTDFKTGSILNPDKNGFTFITSETGYIANIIAIGY